MVVVEVHSTPANELKMLEHGVNKGYAKVNQDVVVLGNIIMCRRKRETYNAKYLIT